MELLAIVASLRVLKKDNLDIEIFSDSSYIVNAFRNKWIDSWKKNGWKTSKKEEVLNQDLWKEMLSLLEGHKFKFYKIKGHLNIEKKDKTLEKEFLKFNKENNLDFSFDEFLEVASKNIRADALANIGMDEIR